MSEEPAIESFEIAGTRFTRHGRFVHVESDRTPEQQEEMDAILARSRDEAEERIATATRELEVELGKYPTFDILSNLMIAELAVDPETYQEWSHQGNQAYVEYATLLALKGEFQADGDQPEIEKIQRLLNEVFQSVAWYYRGELANPENPPDAAAELRFWTIIYGLVDRNPGYKHHLHNIIKRLFGYPSVSAWLKDSLGFTVEEALKLNQAAATLGEDRLIKRRQIAKREEQALETAVQQLRQGKPIPERFQEEVVREYAKLNESEMQQSIHHMFVAWTFYGLGDTMSFTADELADAASVDTAATQAYLNARSLEFGTVCPQFTMPTPTSRLAQRPFVHHEGRYLVTAPSWLNWGLKDYLEDQLKPGRFWQRYSQLRGEFLEKVSLELLSNALPHAEVYRNLKYSVVEDGVTKEVELDGLILLDRALFLVEAKAGSLTGAAQRGAPKSIRTDLRKLLGEAHSQGLRARTYITETERPTFKPDTGEVVHIESSQVDHIFVVAVTLDPLAVFTPMLHEVAQLGIFAPGELPWAVPIYDLQVICEMLEFPCQLVHYLQRRSRLNELGRMETTDELDWFGHYLTEGLYFEDYPTDYQIVLGTYTTEFDDYYLYEQGQRSTPATKPRQPMPKYMRQLLTELEEQHPPDYLTGALILLDMPSQCREEFARLAEMQRRRPRDGRKIHDFTLPLRDLRDLSMGVSVFTTKWLSANELWEKLETYCHFKKYEFRADRWAGFGIQADRPGSFHVYCADSTPWQLDAATSAALQTYNRRIRT